MSQQGEELHPEGSGAQDAPLPDQIQPPGVHPVQEIIPHIEEIDPDNMYRPQPQRAPSIHSQESSIGDLQPPEYHWFWRLLGWLILHIWALTQALMTGAQHGFGALVRALHQSRALRAYCVVSFFLLFLMGPGVQSAFWEKRRAYKMGEDDIENCPPGYRLNRASLSKWGLFAPNCVQIGTTGDVWFPENLAAHITREALYATFTKSGHEFWHWLQWLLSYLIAKSSEGTVKEELRTQLAEVKEHTTRTTHAIQEKVKETGLEVKQATELVAVETQKANEAFVRRMADRIEDLIGEAMEDLGDATGVLIKAYEKEAAETIAEEQIQENRRQRKQKRNCEKQVIRLKKQLAECKKSKACKTPPPDPTPPKAEVAEGRSLESLLVDIITSVRNGIQHWFSPTSWWKFFKKIPTVFNIFKKLASFSTWIMALAWWQMVVFFLIGGNIFVLMLNLLLSAFRIVDQTISLSTRLGMLLRAIVTLLFNLLSYLAWAWWIATKNAFRTLFRFGRRPSGQNDGRQRRNRRRGGPPRHGGRNDRGNSDDDDDDANAGFRPAPRQGQRVDVFHAPRDEPRWQERPQMVRRRRYPEEGVIIEEGPVQMIRPPARQGPRPSPNSRAIVPYQPRPAGRVPVNRRPLMQARPILPPRPHPNPRQQQHAEIPRRPSPPPRREPSLAQAHDEGVRQRLPIGREPSPQQSGRHSPSGSSTSRESSEWKKLRKEIYKDLGFEYLNQKKCKHCNSTEHRSKDCPHAPPKLGESPRIREYVEPPHRSLRMQQFTQDAQQAARQALAPQRSNVQGTDAGPSSSSTPQQHVRNSPRATPQDKDQHDEFTFWARQSDPKKLGRLYYVKGFVGTAKKPMDFIVDTGSAMSILPWKKLKSSGAQMDHEGKGAELVGFAGKKEIAKGTLTREITIGNEERKITFYVAERANKPILGLDALARFGFTLNCADGVLQTEDKGIIYCHVVEAPDQQAVWNAEKVTKNE